jgi:hypothetical protein
MSRHLAVLQRKRENKSFFSPKIKINTTYIFKSKDLKIKFMGIYFSENNKSSFIYHTVN